MKKLLFTFCLILFCSSLYAQEDSHMQAVDELMDAMHMKQQVEESAERMLKVQAQSMPQIAQYKDVMEAFFDKYINWETVGDEIKKVYKESFTEQEIQDLITFYESDIGQKYAKSMPKITEKTALISQGIVMEHQAELQQKIMDSMQN